LCERRARKRSGAHQSSCGPQHRTATCDQHGRFLPRSAGLPLSYYLKPRIPGARTQASESSTLGNGWSSSDGWPTAVSTERPCTQLTPSSAERARKEHRHPQSVAHPEEHPVDPLENTIRRLQPSASRKDQRFAGGVASGSGRPLAQSGTAATILTTSCRTVRGVGAQVRFLSRRVDQEGNDPRGRLRHCV
jgi:hypothetical protein